MNMDGRNCEEGRHIGRRQGEGNKHRKEEMKRRQNTITPQISSPSPIPSPMPPTFTEDSHLLPALHNPASQAQPVKTQRRATSQTFILLFRSRRMHVLCFFFLCTTTKPVLPDPVRWPRWLHAWLYVSPPVCHIAYSQPNPPHRWDWGRDGGGHLLF
ncbi:uncharacterized protein BKA78DRAFT_314930 [Phyllosticta capitalensis]|uniref:uncharacterized protein n=1 Tax=Phyllosticta capitalensis TaxID=121624 RepID=UPI00312D7963